METSPKGPFIKLEEGIWMLGLTILQVQFSLFDINGKFLRFLWRTKFIWKILKQTKVKLTIEKNVREIEYDKENLLPGHTYFSPDLDVATENKPFKGFQKEKIQDIEFIVLKCS